MFRRRFILNTFFIFGICVIFLFLIFSTKIDSEELATEANTIKVGVLHSLTGTMAISEKAVAEGTLLAIDEINKKGGLLGKQIQAIQVDGKSDSDYFAKMAEKLIVEDKVNVIFGCWTSACRKTIKPIIEKYQNLLFYPIQYEGLEQSANIIYTGASPNQQIIPAVKWAFANLGKKFFLVGSDYIFPRIANDIMKNEINNLGGKIVGEEYILLGSQDVQSIVHKIVEAKPEVILNTINGDTNLSFFRELRKAGIDPSKTPTISFSIAENELKNMGTEVVKMAGDYAAWNYFEIIDSPENKNFVTNFKRKYGEQSVTDDPIEAGYLGVYLWAEAVKKGNSVNTETVVQNIKNLKYLAPEGKVIVDPELLHIWKIARIGKIREDGQFDIVWSSEQPLPPIPFPNYRTRAEWDSLLRRFYQGWKENWSNLGNNP